MLVNVAEIKQALEEKIGLKCDEVFLEDSAVRFLKDSLLKKECDCSHFEYIFVNVDDNNINLKRLMTTIKFLCEDNRKEVRVFGCSSQKGSGDAKTLCARNAVTYVQLPIQAEDLKVIMLQ